MSKTKTADAIVGHFIPKGQDEELRATHARLADLNRQCINSARAQSRKHFTLWGTHQVHDDDGNLIGHQVYGERRSLAHQESIFKAGRKAIVERARTAAPARPTGHAPQEATNTRAKGSKRTTGSGRTSSGEDDDPEPPPRRCQACGEDITSLVRPGPGRPRTYCENPDCKRKRNRAYVRKHRGGQWVLAKWTEDGRTYSIVDLDLARERDPEDTAGGWLDERATFWIENGPELATDQRIAAATVEDRAMLEEWGI